MEGKKRCPFNPEEDRCKYCGDEGTEKCKKTFEILKRSFNENAFTYNSKEKTAQCRWCFKFYPKEEMYYDLNAAYCEECTLKDHLCHICLEYRRPWEIGARRHNTICRYCQKETISTRQKENSAALTDSYVKTVIKQTTGLEHSQITHKMIDLKRQSLLIYREKRRIRKEIECLKSRPS